MPKEIHYARYLGYSDIDNILAVSRDYQQNWSEEQVKQLFDLKTEAFESLAGRESIIIDGVSAFVKMLSDKGLPLAVCSGATRRDIELMLDGSDLKGAFRVIITADDVTKGKPDPEGYLLTLKRLNAIQGSDISPGGCVVIEDSMWGLEAARRAGMASIGVTNTYEAQRLEDLADHVVARLDEVTFEELVNLCTG